MRVIWQFAASLLLLAGLTGLAPAGVIIKDLGRIEGWRDNSLVGYGLVTGLAGTGDTSRNRATQQSIANLLKRFDISVGTDDILNRNVAAVMVSATLPPYARVGDKLDITVTSVGDARSLAGGTLMITPLKGPDDRIHALAQGAISVGGYKFDLNDNVVQKNHPTVGLVSGGATVEVGVTGDTVRPDGTIVFVLSSPDYTTAERVAEAINRSVGKSVAKAQDPQGVQISFPDAASAKNPIRFVTQIENISVDPGRRARVIVNERTGTVVSGGDVRISPVVISHGNLRVTIVTENIVSQPMLVRDTGQGVRTEVVPSTHIDVNEAGSKNLTMPSNTVADLVAALGKIKASTRDVISILNGVKAAGALHAELIVQ